MNIGQAAALLIVAEVIIIVVAVAAAVTIGRFIRSGAREMPPAPGDHPPPGEVPAPGPHPSEWTGSPPTYGTTDD